MTLRVERDQRQQGSRAKQLLLFAVGLLSVGIAFLGAVLPLLPATPFALLAAACFARSSPRFHRWLRQHRWFGPPLRSWQTHRAIPQRSKVLAIGSLWVTLPISIFLVYPNAWLVALLAGILVLATAVVLRIPTLDGEPPENEPPPHPGAEVPGRS